MVTPLGKDPKDVLHRIEAGEVAAASPADFDVSPFACRVCAQVKEFTPQNYVAEPKMVRLMNRDAQLAVAAARLALENARLTVGDSYAPEEIALFGAAGLAGLPLRDVTALIRNSVSPGKGFDLERFGRQGLRSISPLLSFKVLGNMPVCFVSICENIQGPNCIYTPWEGQGAQAIEAGLRAIQCGDARAALVGGCDVKTHELAFLSLEQQGIFDGWRNGGTGTIPGEGAVFLVLEDETAAVTRGGRVYARIKNVALGTKHAEECREKAFSIVLAAVLKGSPVERVGSVVAAADGNQRPAQEEASALSSLGLGAVQVLRPKHHAGDLFAAAAALQVGLGALLADRGGPAVLANCFGHGSEQAAFLLEAA
jgi:3-oxoacyl-(acyl-carrier-protein) synthase